MIDNCGISYSGVSFSAIDNNKWVDIEVEIKVTDVSIPFLKWAGGKRWLISNHENLIPTDFDRYIEPFLGSAAMFFYLRPKKSILSDINQDLINTYEAIKAYPDEVEVKLAEHHRKHSKEYYYRIRESNPRKIHTKAAKFIYLNRTCWNGLYRVNREGKFNVPKGTKSNVILKTDNFSEISKLLKRATILCRDFESVIDSASKRDLVFVDPPYTINHNYNGFIKYNENLFSWEDQIRLKDSLFRAKKRGAKIIATNAAHDSVKELYENDFNMCSIKRKSVIGSSAASRGSYEELFIWG